MGEKKSNEKIKVNSKRFKKISNFIKTILKLKHSERIIYFKTITKTEIDILSEIVLNFIKTNIKVDSKAYNLLKRLQVEIGKLAKSKVSYKIKREIIRSIKGLNIINILLPFAIKYFL